jgi:selenocysteine lyase/cysteine desulfurase
VLTAIYLGIQNALRYIMRFTCFNGFHGRGRYLHHNFVAALLNDMFGVQARGGCACAGPYAQELMGIDHALAKRFETVAQHSRRNHVPELLVEARIGTDTLA